MRSYIVLLKKIPCVYKGCGVSQTPINVRIMRWFITMLNSILSIILWFFTYYLVLLIHELGHAFVCILSNIPFKIYLGSNGGERHGKILLSTKYLNIYSSIYYSGYCDINPPYIMSKNHWITFYIGGVVMQLVFMFFLYMFKIKYGINGTLFKEFSSYYILLNTVFLITAIIPIKIEEPRYISDGYRIIQIMKSKKTNS